MKKIISLFKRDYEGTHQAYNETVDGAEWVLSGKGKPTEKFDGTACMVKDDALYKRFDAKEGREIPPGWAPCEPERDPNTGHWPGWVPVGDGPEDKYHREAFSHCDIYEDGTYELIGEKVQGNPYDLTGHHLARHGEETLIPYPPRNFNGLKQYLEDNMYIEGIVWHHHDGRMVKIKRRDFGLEWPIE